MSPGLQRGLTAQTTECGDSSSQLSQGEISADQFGLSDIMMGLITTYPQ